MPFTGHPVPTLALGESSSAATGSGSGLDDSFLEQMARSRKPAVEPDKGSLQRGDRLGGDDGKRFEIVDNLGFGSMGMVYSAWDSILERTTAIKFILHRGARPRDELIGLFHREARSAAKLHHENLIRIFDLGTWNGVPFLVMEYLEGESLDAVLQKKRPTASQATQTMMQIAAGLAHAHEQGIVHRDLKPSNVFVIEGGARVKILDFGIARQTVTLSKHVSIPVSGTPAYMAPEQWRGQLQDARTDIWAAGVIFFELLTGRQPYSGADLRKLRVQVISPDPAPSVRSIRPDLPSEADRIVARALEKDPELRFRTANELLAALTELAAVLSGETRGEQQQRVTNPKPGRDELAGADVAAGQGAGRFESTSVRATMPLVGRERELETLHAMWGRANAGAGQLVLLLGEPGVGKTRLVEELREHASTGESLRLTCQCWPRFQNSPLHPIIEMLLRLAQIDREDPPAQSLLRLEQLLGGIGFDLTDSVPVFASLLSIPLSGHHVPLSVAPKVRKARTLEALASLLQRIASRLPLLFVAEDLQWADHTTLELLTILVDRIEKAPVLVLLTGTHDFRPPWPARSWSHPTTLDRLSPDRVEALVKQIAGSNSDVQPVLDELVARPDCIPLLIEQRMRMLFDERLQGASDPPFPAGRATPFVPVDVGDLVLSRLERLGSRAKEHVVIGSVLGCTFDSGLVAAVSGAQEPGVDESLLHLVEAGLLQPVAHSGLVRYQFRHALIQEAVYRSLPWSARRRYHGEAAKALKRLSPRSTEIQPELIAHHCSESGAFENAIAGWLLAARIALQSSANEEAVGHVKKAIEVAAGVPDLSPHLREELLLQIAPGSPLMETEAAKEQMAAWFADHGNLLPSLAEVPAVPSRPALPFWTESGRDYGAFHRADNKAAVYRPDVLLVFVHGIFGSTPASWGNLPAQVLAAASLDVDVLSFEYGAGLWSDTSIEQAAADLTTVLTTSFSTYRNLVFIGHGSGGLVIKQLLANDDTTDGAGPATIRAVNEGKLTCRTRSVVDICVPRKGRAGFPTSLGSLTYDGVSLCLHPVLALLNHMAPRRYALGRNRAVAQLGARSGFVEALIKRYETHVARYESLGVPTPEMVEIDAGPQGDATGEKPAPAGSTHRFREIRSSGQRSARDERQPGVPSPLSAYLAERLGPFRAYPGAAIARLTISRTCASDPQVLKLFGARETTAIPAEAPEGPAGESQAALLARLMTAATTTSPQSRLVIGGPTGVGKSVLLRVLARQLSILWLRGQPRASLPLLFPLIQFKIDTSSPDPKTLWHLLCAEWIAWVNEVLSYHASESERSRQELITIDEYLIENQLRHQPTTLILDGVDEFLLNHPKLSSRDFASMLDHFRTAYRENTRLSIFAAVRSSGRDAALLAESPSRILTLRSMTLSEASAMFPAATRLLGSASESRVREALLTPLILSNLETSNMQLQPEDYLNRATMIHAALSAIISSLKETWMGAPHATSSWIDALSLVAWYQYESFRGEIDEAAVAEYAARKIAAWSAAAGAPDAASEAIGGFRLLLDQASRLTLLNHSIFLRIRERSYRLKHKEWGDYLVSRYAVLCIRHGFFDDLSARSLNHDIYIMAGQQLLESDSDRKNVQALVQRARTGGRFYSIGNFVVMLGDSFAPITGDVLEQEILAKLDVFPSLVHFVNLSALASRVLQSDPRDRWVRHIKPGVVRALHRRASDDAENALVRSVSWCFLKAMSETTAPWPGLWSKEKDSLDALSMISTRTADGFVVDERQASTQAAFSRIQSYAAEIPSRVISTVHYLYPLVLAYARGVSLERTVVLDLPSVLSDARLDAIYLQHPVREVGEIWKRCHELQERIEERGSRREGDRDYH